jgi:hypothetical protein
MRVAEFASAVIGVSKLAQLKYYLLCKFEVK